MPAPTCPPPGCRLSLADLPPLDEGKLALRVEPGAERAVRDGHPWLFAGSVTSESRLAPAGTVAVVFDRKNRFLAAGLHDPDSPIRVRLLVHGNAERIGPDFFLRRIRRAVDLRKGVLTPTTTACRLVHGENDGMPGLVVDRYGSTLVLKVYSKAWLPHLRAVVPALSEVLEPEGILLLGSERLVGARGAGGEFTVRNGTVLAGSPPLGPLPFLESGFRFEAHPVKGHKTGFYLDQRENRRRLEVEVRGGRVLNVFAHTGAFSVYAARGGADEVVSLDVSGPALTQADRHFALNRDDGSVAHCRHSTLEGDAFERLKALATSGERFGTVILDPPAFAKAAGHVERALRAYDRLTVLALRLLVEGGLLLQASCSSRVGPEAFFAGIHAAARGVGSELEEVGRTGHPPDHPIGFPEGGYLKCLWARVRSSRSRPRGRPLDRPAARRRALR